MNCKAVAEYIAGWMDGYAGKSGIEGFVIGVSGGVDSAVSSALAAITGRPTLCVILPIHQSSSHVGRAREHIERLSERFPNVASVEVDMTAAFGFFMDPLPPCENEDMMALSAANVRSRLRMTALYYFAGQRNALVVGTGNKVEDFGIGFFTKYGDGGVDINPIADLTKSEVFEIAAWLGVSNSILDAPPTDGLFGDDRTDEQQIGATYPELEWAMAQAESGADTQSFSPRQREVYDIYVRRNRINRHKMASPPVCLIPASLK